MSSEIREKQKISALLLIIIFFLAGIFLIGQPSKNLNLRNKPEDIRQVKIAGQTINVDLALTSAEQEQGLSARVVLAEDSGMLFVFSAKGGSLFGGGRVPKFWMKDMNFPIDMIWLDENLKVIYIKKDARPESYPETFGPDVSQNGDVYVLEVSSGFSEKNNLLVGDKAELTY